MTKTLEFNLYDDYLSIYANTIPALEVKLAEMKAEGWEPLGDLEDFKTPDGIYLEQPLVRRKPFPGSLPAVKPEHPKLLKPDLRIPYDHMRWEWISSHWDIHLAGLCWVGKELMRFTTECSPFKKNLKCHVFRLSPEEHLDWRIQQRLFEWCVGYHWSYRGNRVRGKSGQRRPVWFWWYFVTKLYYKMRGLRN